jgi:hypothetical protein
MLKKHDEEHLLITLLVTLRLFGCCAAADAVLGGCAEAAEDGDVHLPGLGGAPLG